MASDNAANSYPFRQNDQIAQQLFLGGMGDLYDSEWSEPHSSSLSMNTNPADLEYDEYSLIFPPDSLWTQSVIQQPDFLNSLMASAPLSPTALLPSCPPPLMQSQSGFVVDMPQNTSMPVIEEARSLPSPDELPHPKRLKKSEQGFPCRFPGCPKVFDRNGDANKHFERTHTPEESRPFKCPKCPKRFNWAKDVRRHDVQMHSSGRGATSRSLVRRAAHQGPGPHSVPKIDLRMLFRGNPPQFESIPHIIRNLMATRRFVLQLKVRRARRKSQSQDDGKFIMVTSDGRDFRAIDVSCVENANDLMKFIYQELPHAEGLSLTQYMLGRGTVGASLQSEQLFAQVFEQPSNPGPLYFHLGEQTIKQESGE